MNWYDWLTLAVCVGALGLVFRLGAARGSETERLRVSRIFDVATYTVSSPTVNLVWACFREEFTTEQMRTELLHYAERKRERHAAGQSSEPPRRLA